MQIKDLKQDEHNYRKHNERNLNLIKKSVSEVGLGRSVVIDNENEIICGNGLVSTLDKNTPIKVIETDGTQLVVVKRTDLKTDDEKRKQLAIMDNSTSDSSEFDLESLQADFSCEKLGEWGIDFVPVDEITEEILENEENIYTKKIDIPKYTPNGKKPAISELYENQKVNSLINEIEKSEVPNEIKDFLKIAATRHYKFSFKNIAEFYAQSDKKIQELFEKQALVLIDFNSALENGYVNLCKDIREVLTEDYSSDEIQK